MRLNRRVVVVCIFLACMLCLTKYSELVGYLERSRYAVWQCIRFISFYY